MGAALGLSLFGGPPAGLTAIFCASPWLIIVFHFLSVYSHFLPAGPPLPSHILVPSYLCALTLSAPHRLGSFHFLSLVALPSPLNPNPSFVVSCLVCKTRISSLFLDGGGTDSVNGHCPGSGNSQLSWTVAMCFRSGDLELDMSQGSRTGQLQKQERRAK